MAGSSTDRSSALLRQPALLVLGPVAHELATVVELPRFIVGRYAQLGRELPPATVQFLADLQDLAALHASGAGQPGQPGHSHARKAPDPGRMLTLMAVARRLNITDRTLRRWCAGTGTHPIAGARRDPLTGAWSIPEPEVERLEVELGRAA